MDIQAYIQSGVIESYVLGIATEEEIAEVESLRQAHPQVQEAIKSFSVLLEEQAMANAIQPPPHIKEKILQSLSEVAESIPFSATTLSKSETPVHSINKYKMLAAASVILLIISAGANFYLYNQYSEKDKAYQALFTERNSLFANNQVYQTNLKDWETAANMMADPAMAVVKMKGVPGKESGLATIYWDTRNKDVFIRPNNLPSPEAGKQYQLWAFVDGKPVDAGVFEMDCAGLCKMKNIPKAEGFAVTLENSGGSPTPTVSNMFVLGTI